MKPFHVAAFVAIASRLIVWFGSMIVPIPNEARAPISPLHANSAIDLTFYQNSRAFYATWLDRFAAAPLDQWWGLIKAFWLHASSSFISGPLMSGLLAVFDYSQQNPLPLAAIYLLISCAIVVAWLHWLHRMGTELTGLLILALMPGPFWFTLNISSDLPFAGLFTIFFFVFFSSRPARQRYIYATAVAIVATLLRPHGISLLLFLGLYGSLLSPGRTRRQRIIIGAGILLIGGALLWLSNVYFLSYVRSSTPLPYFGWTTVEYLAGIFPFLPDGLDRLASWLALPVAKLLYLAGMRPSYSDTLPIFVFVRAACGPLLLAGLIYAFLRAPWAYRFLFAAYLAPVSLGSAQDRYLLALTPLIIFFAVRLAQQTRGTITGHSRTFPPLPLQKRIAPPGSVGAPP